MACAGLCVFCQRLRVYVGAGSELSPSDPTVTPALSALSSAVVTVLIGMVFPANFRVTLRSLHATSHQCVDIVSVLCPPPQKQGVTSVCPLRSLPS